MTRRQRAIEIAEDHYERECERLGLRPLSGDVVEWVIEAIAQALGEDDPE